MVRSAVVAVAAAAGSAHAAGFAIDTQSARATGMGQAVAGLVDDPSAIYFNPAGLAATKGFNIQLGDSLILAGLHYTPAGGSEWKAEAPPSPPPHGFVSYALGDFAAVGVGLTTPFGSRAGWPEGWAGRAASTGSALAVYEASPTVGLRLLDGRLRLGGGVRLMRGTVEINRDLAFPGEQFGSVKLGGASNGFGYSAGVQFDAVPDLLTVGASFRSSAELNFEGNAHFENVPAEFRQQLFDQGITSRVELPATLRMGVGLRPMPALKLGADVLWTDWTSFQSLDITFTETSNTTFQEKDWHDAWSVQLGGEYALSEALQLRAGLGYDPTPSPTHTLTPDLPDSNRYRVSVGAGYAAGGGLRFDLGYQLVLLEQRESTVPEATGLRGTYGGSAHVVSLTAGLAL